MKKIKNWWKQTPWLCKIFGCRWEHVAGSVVEVVKGGLIWRQQCYRCRTERDLSRCYGIVFVDGYRKF